jgi:bifunctional non-homologous end joining protein LigD
MVLGGHLSADVTCTARRPAIGAIQGKLSPDPGTPVEGAAGGNEWVSEIKFDGYRLLATVEDGKVRLLTRKGHDWAERMPSVAAS